MILKRRVSYDALDPGSCLLPRLFVIIIRFRAYKYAIWSDIKSAFLNIGIQIQDRDFLRFLWINDVYKEPPEVMVWRKLRLCCLDLIVLLIF